MALNDLSPSELIIIESFEDRFNEPFSDNSERVLGDLGTFTSAVNEFLPSLLTSPTVFDVFFFDELPRLVVGDAGVAIGFEDALPGDFGNSSLAVNGALPSEDDVAPLLTLSTIVDLLFFDELPGLLVGDGDVAIDFEGAFDKISDKAGGEKLVFVCEIDLEFCCPGFTSILFPKGRSAFLID